MVRLCKNCFAPFTGPLAPLVRPLGHGPSPLSPDLCRRCFAHVPLGGAEVEITVLFVSLHMATTYGVELPLREFSASLNRVYESPFAFSFATMRWSTSWLPTV